MNFIPDVPKISKKTFDKISSHVKQQYGINLTDAKLNLVENRLIKRIRHHKLSSFEEYAAHLFGTNGQEELNHLCDYLSTNKTYFYREPSHFDFLKKLMQSFKPYGSVSIWSAACSAGDEVYTISALLEELNREKRINYSILGTDISNNMIAEAQWGEYASSRLSQMPAHYTKRFFTKTTTGDGKEMYQVKDVLKRHVRFKKFNLVKDMPALQVKFDVIFCRNVLIYFNEETKMQVINDLIKKLKPGGYLILGHCEGMLSRNTNLKQIQPAVFQKPLNS